MTGRQSQSSQCHRFLTGSPNPEVGHQGVPGDSQCSLQHHPPPCPWTDSSGAPCTHYPPARDVGESEAAEEAIQVQLENVWREREQERLQIEQLQIANRNLILNQERLRAEYRPGVPSVAGFSTATTTTVSSSFCPLLTGTGFSSGFAA